VADARITDPERAIDLAAPAPVVLEGDEVRLRQVAANLVMNALIHAGPEAHVRVGARAHDHWAELEVSDDGVGMPPEVAEHVFEPFFHANGEPADDSAPGEAEAKSTTGLGLAIALGIAEAHGGSIDLETAPGRGSRFLVRLPLAVEEARSGEATAAAPDFAS
jgi:two-component system OmpR family sensor kinase